LCAALQGIRDYAEQQRRLLSEIATYSARNLAILAGLTPSQNAMSNSNSAVNTSVPVTQCDSQPLEATSTTTNTAEDNSANTSTSCQRPSLNLSHSEARSETLESPAYIPSDFNPLPHDVTETQVISSDKQLPVAGLPVAGAEPKNVMQVSSDAHQSLNILASISIESETPAVTYDKLMPAQHATTGKTSKFAARVRRKFTVSKTVLPSNAPAPVVVFSKLAAEAASPREVQNMDDVSRVHIVDKALSSNVSALDKSPVCDVSLSPSSVDISAVEPVTDVPTASTCTLESTVITRTGELCTDNTDTGEVTVECQLQSEASECDLELAKSTGVQSVACNEDVGDQMSSNHYDESTDENVEMCSSMSEVDSTLESCAASEHSAAEASSLACKSESQINDRVGPPSKDASDLREITGTVDKCGVILPAPLGSCPIAVNDVSFNCAACECGDELNSVQCTTDELPSSDAFDDILVAQETNTVAACSTVERMVVDMPFEVSSLPSSKQDTLQQNLECDNNSHIAESTPPMVATQCSSPVQKQIDDKS